MKHTYKTSGVCSRSIEFELDDDIIKDVKFIGGCNGSLSAVSALVTGKKVSEVTDILETIGCGSRGTSCPAQLAKALKQVQ